MHEPPLDPTTTIGGAALEPHLAQPLLTQLRQT
jgi:hypothetical protein